MAPKLTLLGAAVSLLAAATPACADVLYAQVTIDRSGSPQFVQSNEQLPLDNTVVAWCTFNDSIPLTGWATLEVHTSSWGGLYTDEVQAYAAGYVEGAVTVQREFEYITNAYSNQTFGNGLDAFIKANFDWVKKQVAANVGDAYWHHVGLSYRQFEGLYDGYSAAALEGQQLDMLMFYSSTMQGDLHDLNVIFAPNGTASGTKAAVDDDGHCSLLVKPVGPASAPTELYIAHTTWSHFETMTRMFKMYDFPWTLNGTTESGIVPARQMSFSSYPAAIFSGDDWYVTSASLVIAETTIANNNASLWRYVQPATVLEWVRNMVANRLAGDAPTWASVFSQYNSGTYNNMWHVVDYNKFVPGQPLADDVFWVLEQLPGPYIAASDHTQVLRNELYWASYNRIATPALFNISNQWALVEQYGPHFSYAGTSRALIFARDHATVVDTDSLARIMRYNDFLEDPLGIQVRCGIH